MDICNGNIDTAVPVHKVILELSFFLLCCGAGQYFPLIVTKLLVLFYSAIHIPLTYISGRNSSIKILNIALNECFLNFCKYLCLNAPFCSSSPLFVLTYTRTRSFLYAHTHQVDLLSKRF